MHANNNDVSPSSLRAKHRLTTAVVKLLLAILVSIQGRGQAAIEAQYVATGRLSTLRVTIGRLFAFFLAIISNPEKKQKVVKPIKLQKKAPSVTKKFSSLSIESILALSSSDGKKKKAKSAISKTSRESPLLAKICSATDVISPPRSSSDNVEDPPSLHSLAVEGMNFLVRLEGGIGTVSGACGARDGKGMKDLMMRHGLPLLSSAIDSCAEDVAHPHAHAHEGVSASASASAGAGAGVVLEIADVAEPPKSSGDGGDSNGGLLKHSQNIFDMDGRDLRLLISLASSPWGLPLSSPAALSHILSLILTSTKKTFLSGDTKEMEDQLLTCSELLMTVLVPFCYTAYPATAAQTEVFSKDLFNSSSAVSAMVERCSASQCTEGSDNVDVRTQGDSHAHNYMGELSGIEAKALQGVQYWTGYLSGERVDVTACADSQHVPLRGTSRTSGGWAQSAVMSDIVTDHLENIVDVFVLSPIWSRSTALQVRSQSFPRDALTAVAILNIFS